MERYTYHDWRDGKLPLFENKSTKESEAHYLRRIALYTFPPLIDFEDYKKIVEKKKETYLRYVKYRAKVKVMDFLGDLFLNTDKEIGKIFSLKINSIKSNISLYDAEIKTIKGKGPWNEMTLELYRNLQDHKINDIERRDISKVELKKLPKKIIQRMRFFSGESFQLLLDYYFLQELEQSKKDYPKFDYYEVSEKKRLEIVFDSPGKPKPKNIAFYEYLYHDKYSNERSWPKVFEIGDPLYKEITGNEPPYSSSDSFLSSKSGTNTEMRKKINHYRKILKGNLTLLS